MSATEEDENLSQLTLRQDQPREHLALAATYETRSRRRRPLARCEPRPARDPHVPPPLLKSPGSPVALFDAFKRANRTAFSDATPSGVLAAARLHSRGDEEAPT